MKTGKDDSPFIVRIDLIVIVLANLINIAMVGLFAARMSGLPQIQYVLGVAALVMGFSLGYMAFLNQKAKRDKWLTYLLVPILLFFVVELVIDYVLALDFRSTVWVGPYILLYYAGLWGLVGYAFKVNAKTGFITLVTYFANMILSILPYI
ncbi:MAG: hypothetical protein NWE99_01145 [Candidatus Bathyarchaeota archaeon]|nr:hypothetical protein [Candidatus Bathyarchaeota archaeon]